MLRKKRVTISDQAQAAIAAGVPVSTALAEHGEPVPDAAEETTEITAEGETGEPEATTEVDTEVEAVTDNAITAEAADGIPGDEEPAPPAAQGEGTNTISALLDRLQTAQSTVATQEAELKTLKEASESDKASLEALKGVCIEAIHRMQIGLGGVATDLSSLSAENLLAQYRSTLTLMQERFPVGGKAEVPVDDSSRNGSVVPLINPAVARATQIRK